MEKQVTGPSALQVAVLKTSLQEGKHMSSLENQIYTLNMSLCNVWKDPTLIL